MMAMDVRKILNILYLVAQGLLDLPVLYLSHYLIHHKADYYHYIQSSRYRELGKLATIYVREH